MKSISIFQRKKTEVRLVKGMHIEEKRKTKNEVGRCNKK